RNRLEQNAVGDRLGRWGEKIVGRQRSVGLIIQVAADAIASSDLHDDVILRPAEPARLDIAGNTAAIAEIMFAEESAVGDRQIAADKLEIDMTPGLRPICGTGDVGRDVLGRVEAE